MLCAVCCVHLLTLSGRALSVKLVLLRQRDPRRLRCQKVHMYLANMFCFRFVTVVLSCSKMAARQARRPPVAAKAGISHHFKVAAKCLAQPRPKLSLFVGGSEVRGQRPRLCGLSIKPCSTLTQVQQATPTSTHNTWNVHQHQLRDGKNCMELKLRFVDQPKPSVERTFQVPLLIDGSHKFLFGEL